MYQHFSRPDWYFARTGRLYAAVTEHRISGAPAFMRGLRALFVSDVHAIGRTRQGDLEALAQRMAGASPDLVLLGGDYADRREDALRVFKAWRGLHAPLGCYAVMGNNDAEAWESPLALRREMERFGCHLLVNQSERLRLNAGTLYIAGLDDYRYGHPDSTGLYPASPAPDAWRILLSHYPCRPALAPDLMLSGHTHGGQFNVLGLTPYAIGFERFSRPRRPSMAIAGLREIDGIRLLVSKGIGASRLQLRVGVRPEVNLLVFE